MFYRVNRDGTLMGESQTLTEIECDERSILGVNQNLRLTKFDWHIQETDSMFDPLRHYIGCGTPQRFFADISAPAPNSFYEPNREQQRVAHPLALTTAVEVAGPPGTGKTKIITELVRSILECTQHKVIVSSERNDAIDAIAEKFADVCVKRNSSNSAKQVAKVRNILLWTSLMSFGSSGSMGSSTKLFTLKEKLRCHPELVELRKVHNEKQKECDQMTELMLSELSNAIEELRGHLPEGADPGCRSHPIRSGVEAGLTIASEIVVSIRDTRQAILDVFAEGLSAIDESEVNDVVLAHFSIFGKLLPIRTKEDLSATSWKVYKRIVWSALQQILKCLEALLKLSLFSLETTEKRELSVRQAEESIKVATQRLEVELVSGARILLSTIGSSHKLPTEDHNAEEDTRDLSAAFDQIYELLGLSRLGRSIDALVCLGDKHQLPPYDPSSSRDFKKQTGPRGRHFRSHIQTKIVKSLLDVSSLTPESGKIMLTTQYRVPRNIASLLNARIYLGTYKTAPECNAPLRGFHFVDVPESRHRSGKKYINVDEIEYCLELVRQFKREGKKHIMILTPYKKQQRELQCRFKRNGYEDVLILTIDQCQKQESDIVIISLVQKPTRFLNKNRLNAALSRVREKLYLIADKMQFREASCNLKWDCSLLAKDLLEMAGADDALESESDQVYRS